MEYQNVVRVFRLKTRRKTSSFQYQVSAQDSAQITAQFRKIYVSFNPYLCSCGYVVTNKLFIPKETPFTVSPIFSSTYYLATIMYIRTLIQAIKQYQFIVQQLSVSHSVSVLLISQKPAQASQQFDANQPFAVFFTTRV